MATYNVCVGCGKFHTARGYYCTAECKVQSEENAYLEDLEILEEVATR